MKKFFDKLNPRERLLLCCVASVAVFGWLSFLTRGFARADSERSTLAARIKTAKTVVGMSGEISRELDGILASFDVNKTLAPLALQLETEKCARAAALEYSLSNVSERDAGRFKINTITLSCRRADLGKLADFEAEMRKLEPYATFSKAVFDGNSEGEISAKYEISSFEFGSQKKK